MDLSQIHLKNKKDPQIVQPNASKVGTESLSVEIVFGATLQNSRKTNQSVQCEQRTKIEDKKNRDHKVQFSLSHKEVELLEESSLVVVNWQALNIEEVKTVSSKFKRKRETRRCLLLKRKHTILSIAEVGKRRLYEHKTAFLFFTLINFTSKRSRLWKFSNWYLQHKRKQISQESFSFQTSSCVQRLAINNIHLDLCEML